MYKKTRMSGCAVRLLLMSLLFTACAGASEEKIEQAQTVYAELVRVHNQVVEAHKEIEDASLDEALDTLYGKLEQVDDFALNEMKDEDIDFLIETMNTMKSSYQEYLKKIQAIKKAEEAAVLVPVSFSLINETAESFRSLVLYASDKEDQKLSVLQPEVSFEPGQSLLGLSVNMDAEGTPWILVLEDTKGTAYEFELDVKGFAQEGETLILKPDEENVITVTLLTDAENAGNGESNGKSV